MGEKNHRRLLIIAPRRILLLLLFLQIAAFPQTGKVIGVLDGDTIDMLIDGRPYRIRLEGIDAPEKRQAYGQRSRQHLSDMIYGKQVKLSSSGSDRYGRTLGHIYTADGVWVNREMIVAGYAWHYKQYSSDFRLSVAEDAARNSKAGLWNDKNPVPPWDYRRGGSKNSRRSSSGSTNSSIDRQTTSTQCRGTTKKGKRCKRMTKDPSGYCWQHK